ncbi:hypothetical protein [Cerasicoccus arenae]|uniref:Uncharacterized protein n=1 Tax=Cerasicoccus arenae TaxID=424488 RepID=A0A8J3DA85_9BACT|nr:hypothetical protein [Cerasicoccus arenae]MBK1859451.1 hypothetical protein [Cerasicoccus arenae]GHB94219.1 hypothetical protein GCM10007047_07360 [Cerasicoccus arenae]
MGHAWKIGWRGLICLLLLSAVAQGVTFDWSPIFFLEEETLTELNADGETIETEQTTHFRALGPIFEERNSETKNMATMRPLFIQYEDKETDVFQYYFVPPFFVHYRDPNLVRWEIYTFIQRRRTGISHDNVIETFLVVPFIWFHYEPDHPERSYYGIFPIYGEMQEFMFDKSTWALWPLYWTITTGELTRMGTPWPFVQTLHGPGTGGLLLWPIIGHWWQEGRMDYQFLFWPFIYRKVDQLDRPIPRVREGFLPFWATEHGEFVDDVTILFPFFGWKEDRTKNYSEERYFYPFFMQGRGDNHYINRWAPFYTHSIVTGVDKTWYLWPMLRYRTQREKDLIIARTQFCYFLYWNETQRSASNPNLAEAHETHIWPFISEYDNGAGLKQAQLFSPFEVFYPHSQSVRDLYTPLFAFWRSTWHTDTGESRQSFLWDFMVEEKTSDSTRFEINPFFLVHDVAPDHAEFSLGRGLLGYKREGTFEDGAETLQLLWFDIDL